jgi:hypothetical protein
MQQTVNKISNIKRVVHISKPLAVLPFKIARLLTAIDFLS